MQGCSIEFPSLELMRCEGETDSGPSSVHQSINISQPAILPPPPSLLHSYINRPSLQCNLPGIAQYQWESYEWKLVRGVSFLARGNYYLAADPRVFAGGSLQLSNQNILQSHFKRFIMFEILFWGWKRYRNNLLDVTDQ